MTDLFIDAPGDGCIGKTTEGKTMSKPHYLFELDDPEATDADYEDGTGPGRYKIFGWRGEVIDVVGTLDEAEALVAANR